MKNIIYLFAISILLVSCKDEQEVQHDSRSKTNETNKDSHSQRQKQKAKELEAKLEKIEKEYKKQEQDKIKNMSPEEKLFEIWHWNFMVKMNEWPLKYLVKESDAIVIGIISLDFLSDDNKHHETGYKVVILEDLKQNLPTNEIYLIEGSQTESPGYNPPSNSSLRLAFIFKKV